MDTAVILQLVKECLGIRTSMKDETILMRVMGAIKELEDEQGLVLDDTNPYHLEFVVDYAAWRYESRVSNGSIPRHLKFRMHNLIIHNGGGTIV